MDEPTGSFDNIKLSQTYLSIPTTGGTATVTVTATEEWAFVENDTWPNVITRDKTTQEITKSEPAWLAVDKMSGAAGETVLTFSAEASDAGREFELQIKAGNNTQFIRVRQGSMAAVSATCADVIAGPDGKTYRVKGVCTSIANTTYGNWYLDDGTGEIYVYGTLDKDGAEKNFTSWGLEVGDEIEVEGPKTTYGTTIELVNVTVIKINKSLVKVTTEPQHVAKEGGEFEVKVAYKGNGAFYSIPDDVQSWVSVADMSYKSGTPTKIEQNPADTAIVKIAVLPNAGGDRSAKITFSSENAGGSSSVDYTFTQEGSILNVTIPEFLAAAEDATQYRISGFIKSIKADASYHNANVTIADAAGNEAYLYRLVTTEGNIEDYDFKEGDFLTVVGKRSSYNGSPQMAQGCYVESYKIFTAATVAEILAAEVNADKWYRLTGKVANIKNTTYGNFDLVDGSSSIYVYGLTATPVASNDKSFASLGIKEGDIITIAGTRAAYNGTAQVGGPAYIISHQPASGDDQVKVGPFTSNITWTANKDSKSYDDGAATVNGTALDKVLKFRTSSVIGTATVVVPAGTKKIGLWGVAWKGKNGTLVASVAGQQIYTLDFASNDGATGNAPYTITVADSDYYEFDLASILGSALPVDTEVTLSTVEGAERVIVWGLNTYAE